MNATLRALALAATPGPWRTSGDRQVYEAICGFTVAGVRRDYDAAYIAACDPQTILALLDRLDRLEAMHPYGSQQEVGAAVAVLDERARIRAAVEGLPGPFVYKVNYPDLVDRAAVLRVIDGEADRG